MGSVGTSDDRCGRAVKRESIPALLILVLVAGCSTTAAIEPTPGGPCIDGPNTFVGESGLTVGAGAEEVLAAFNFGALEYCPGHKYEGRIGAEADGFLLTLDDTVLHTEPGSTITVRGPGYPGARLTAGLKVISDLIDPENGRVWQLQAPQEPGRHEVDLYLDWEEGRAHYAFLIDTGASQAGGPCLDSSANQLGNPKITVAGVRASFGFSQIGYCPDVNKTGAEMGDGFFHDLENAVVRAEPGEAILVSAPGYPGAIVSSTWRVEDVDGSTEAEMASTGVGQWSLAAPDRAAVYVLDISLEWSEGSAAYAVRVAVGDARLSSEALVPVEPAGDLSIHPTLLPAGFVNCDDSGVDLRFCDPTIDYAWLEIEVQPAILLDSWNVHSHDHLLGAMRLEGTGSQQIGVLLDPASVLTLAASGIRSDILQEIAMSIPAFDSETRGAECEAAEPADLSVVAWKCDLEVGVAGDMVESDVLRFGEIVGDAAVRYQFTPVVEGTGMTQPVVAISSGDVLITQIEDWRHDMVLASEELGIGPTHADPGNYTIKDLLLIIEPEISRGELTELLDQLAAAGFEFEMTLRVRF